MVSWERRDLSSLYRSWIFLSSGCKLPILLIMRLCLTVRGNMIVRMITVKAMMLMPKSLNSTLYNSTRLLIMGRMITSPHISKKISNCYFLFCMDGEPTCGFWGLSFTSAACSCIE